MNVIRACLILICIQNSCGLLADEKNQPEKTPVRFNQDIRPILSDTCFPCHGPDRQKLQADLRLDLETGSGDIRGILDVIVAGKPAQSELVHRILHDDPDERMPPADAARKLSPNQIRLLSDWVSQGANYEKHWSFLAPKRPDIPDVKSKKWLKNPIDAFVLSRMEKNRVAPSPADDWSRVIRRMSLDLTGILPDPISVDRFLKTPSDPDFVGLIDDIMTSPKFGEHWAVMWLDAARYADTNGYNNDTPRYNWRYRDWVINAFNGNLPYDQFIVEQLAGDLLPNATTQQMVATGFNRNHNVTSEGGIVDEEYRLEYVADRVHTTSMVFMALTVRCARCHDHKFDPISQREYYEFFSFFNQVPETGYHKEHVGNVKPVVPVPSTEQASQLAGIQVNLDDCVAQIEKYLTDVRNRQENTIPNKTDLATLEKSVAEKEPGFRKLLGRRQQLIQQRDNLTKAIPTAMVMKDVPQTRTTFLLKRGAYDQPGNRVDFGTPAVFSAFPADAPKNRLGLAQWLIDASHPLTARVIVNRLWSEVFGRGLVTTLEDFGTQGAWPTHPDLLDWLAVELIESGWDLKHILKLMVSSATYRQSPIISPDALRRDPENRWFARGPRFRMKAEMIRDNALAVSGLLVNRLGGPSVRPYQPAGLWVEVAVADDSYSGGPFVQSRGADLYRRSVYTWWKRTCPPPNLNTFDAPEREFCRVQRSRTNTPLQALVLLNDPTFVEAARQLAERTIFDGGQSTPDRIRFLFRQALLRNPNDTESDLMRRAHDSFRNRFAADPSAAERFIQVGDSEPNSEIKPIDLAAWMAVASMVLNLDEFITK